MEKLKVFIVDDHDIFRNGVKVLLNSSKAMEVIGEAKNGKEFVDCIDKYSPDVVLMDISMPVMDGIEATKQAIEKNPDLKVLTFSMFGDEEYYFKMIQSGVKGFILKSSGITELENAIKEVVNGESYFSNDLLRKIILNIKSERDNKDKQLNTSNLSSREIDVLKQIAFGLSNEDIADKLHIGVNTVKTHRANLLSKTGCGNTASLVMFAIKNKIVDIE
jgi:DNA-binding NarL/FixJ family response regulator